MGSTCFQENANHATHLVKPVRPQTPKPAQAATTDISYLHLSASSAILIAISARIGTTARSVKPDFTHNKGSAGSVMRAVRVVAVSANAISVRKGSP